MESMAYQTTPTLVLAFLPSLLATKTNRPLNSPATFERLSGVDISVGSSPYKITKGKVKTVIEVKRMSAEQEKRLEEFLTKLFG